MHHCHHSFRRGQSRKPGLEKVRPAVSVRPTTGPLSRSISGRMLARPHRLTQIVDKIRLAVTPFMNHWWNVPLYVNARALTTSPIPYRNRPFELGFDPLDQELVLQMRDGVPELFPLKPMAVADFYREVMHRLRSSGIEVRIWRMPLRVPDSLPFDEDRVHAASNPEPARTCRKILLSASTA